MNKPFSADGPVDTVTGMTVRLILKGKVFRFLPSM